MRRIPPRTLLEVTTELVGGFGTPESEAEAIAASLVSAELRGHPSHGVLRLSTMYEAMTEVGSIDPEATPETKRQSAAIASVDGNDAFGQLTGRHVVEAGIEAAEETGVSVVGVRNGTHLGRVGEWAERAAEAGFVSIEFVNSGGTMATVAPVGSADRVFATNPIAVGIPTFDELAFPIVLDMATSQVAHGKVTQRAVDGEALPEGWAVTATGERVEDATIFEAGDGALLPLGGQTAGHKGYGLALCAELFGGIIGRGAVQGQDRNDHVNNAGVFLFVDPLRFSSKAEIEEVVRTVRDRLSGAHYPSAVETGDATRGDRALLPGEPEHRTRIRREREGVPLSDAVVGALAELADAHGVETPLF